MSRGDQEEEEEDMSLDEDAEEGDASRKGDRYTTSTAYFNHSFNNFNHSFNRRR